jgi:hypothetical protein
MWPGTLKLLVEDIISCLRREGRKELTFGFAPLFNIRDGDPFKRHLHWVTWASRFAFNYGNRV